MQIELEDLFSRSFLLTISTTARAGAFYAGFSAAFPGIRNRPRCYYGTRLPIEGGMPIGAYTDTPRHRHYMVVGCDHFIMVSMARALDWPYVCIFEDDAKFRPGAMQYIREALKDLPDDISVLKLGYTWKQEGKYKKEKIPQFSNPLLRLGGHTWGSHAVIIFRKYYDRYLNVMLHRDLLPDISVLSGAIDPEPEGGDDRYTILRLKDTQVDQRPTEIRGFRPPAPPKIEGETPLVVGEDVKPVGSAAYPYIPLFYFTHPKDRGTYWMSSPATGLFMLLPGLCSYARTAGWGRLTLLSERFSASEEGRAWLDAAGPRSRVHFGDFGFPDGIDFVAKDFDELQREVDKKGRSVDMLGHVNWIACNSK